VCEAVSRAATHKGDGEFDVLLTPREADVQRGGGMKVGLRVLDVTDEDGCGADAGPCCGGPLPPERTRHRYSQTRCACQRDGEVTWE
jgi:hypothetical protein